MQPIEIVLPFLFRFYRAKIDKLIVGYRKLSIMCCDFEINWIVSVYVIVFDISKVKLGYLMI